MRLHVTLGNEAMVVEVLERDGRYRVQLGDRWLDVDARLPPTGSGSLLIGSVSHLVHLWQDRGETAVAIDGEVYRCRVEEAVRLAGRGAGGRAGTAGERLTAPMPGRVVTVHVRAGDRVEAGAPLVVLEAMKMENEFRASAGGLVSEVHVTPGQAVNAGDLLVVIVAEGSSVGPAP